MNINKFYIMKHGKTIENWYYLILFVLLLLIGMGITSCSRQYTGYMTKRTSSPNSEKFYVKKKAFKSRAKCISKQKRMYQRNMKRNRRIRSQLK